MTVVATTAAFAVRSYADDTNAAPAASVDEKIDRLEQEIQELTEAKKEIYLEAKGNGFDVKVLREVIRLRKQDQKERDEQESLLDLYMEAIKAAAPVAKAA